MDNGFKRKPRREEPVKIADVVAGNASMPMVQSVDLAALAKSTAFDVNKKPKDGQGVLYLQDQIIGSRGNLVCVSGPPKSRKTVITSSFVSSMFIPSGYLGVTADLNPDEIVLAVDTEQGESHYYNSVIRIFKNIGVNEDQIPDRFKSHNTRGLDTDVHIQLIEYLIVTYKPSVVVIDGVVDLMNNINDQEESKRIANMLLRWAKDYNAVIVVVIHTNPGETKKMRGAVGTYLLTKCETVLYVEKDKENRSISNITCQDARNREFAPYSIRYNEETHQYEIIDQPKIKSLPEDFEQVQLIQIRERMFNISNGAIKDKELRNIIVKSVKEVTGYSVKRGAIYDAWSAYITKTFLLQHPEIGWTRQHEKSPDKKSDDYIPDDLPF